MSDTGSVPIDDPAMLEALARYNDQSHQTRRRADLTATIVLLAVHATLAVGTALALFGAVDTDACAFWRCADQAWFAQAVGVAVPAAGLILAADLALAVLRFTRRKRAWIVPLVGSAVQVALALATYTMISEAGLAL